MDNMELNEFINDFSKINGIQAIVLGGSRTTKCSDIKSDYDFYVYSENIIDQEIRKNLFSNYCNYYEIGNSYWELEDNGILKSGDCFQIIYRNLLDFIKIIANVVENHNSCNGFTTCLWHNLLNSEILFDKDGMFKKTKERFSIPYPQKLKENIITRNMALLSDSMESYKEQIIISVYRKDYVNINNRISAFLASYFDIIFAINELTNPGEKRLIEICLSKCKILPNHFEENIDKLLKYQNETQIIEIINDIINELKIIIIGQKETKYFGRN
ncbi:hypothetical protein R84B8_01791 [Treponema sp. R8-4-B8]